jgi:hypothetical protein
VQAKSYDVVFTPVLRQDEKAVDLTHHSLYIVEIRVHPLVVSHQHKTYVFKISHSHINMHADYGSTGYGAIEFGTLAQYLERTCYLHLHRRRRQVPTNFAYVLKYTVQHPESLYTLDSRNIGFVT